ncbi:Uncharacterised protein [[Clostridium] symbiosum]|nr:Uncharacterised protein [[Clostridium] symbiosum]
MYFITTKRMLEVCFSAHPNIQYRTFLFRLEEIKNEIRFTDRTIQYGRAWIFT